MAREESYEIYSRDEAFDDSPGGEEKLPLRTHADIRKEMAKVYRSMRKGSVSIQAGNGLTQTLMYISKVIEVSSHDDLVRRLDAVEKAKESATAVQ